MPNLQECTRKVVAICTYKPLDNETSKLIGDEKKREKALLDNIGDTIKRKLSEQHKSLSQKDKNINKEAVDKKVNEVAKVLSDHIVKGNEIKLLKEFNPEIEGQKAHYELLKESRKASLEARNGLKKLSASHTRFLTERYTIKKEGESKKK